MSFETKTLRLISEMRDMIEEINTMNARMLDEMQKQNEDIAQLRRAVFGYAYSEPSMDDYEELGDAEDELFWLQSRGRDFLAEKGDNNVA